MKFIPLKSPDSPESEYVNYIDLGAKKGVSWGGFKGEFGIYVGNFLYP